MQFKLNIMDRFIVILLVLSFVKMIHQALFFLQVHEQIVTPQRFFMFLVQCQNFSIFVFNGITLIFDISIKIGLLVSFIETSTIIMRIEFCNGIKNNCNPMGRITIRIDVDDVFNGMFFMINIYISIKISISILFLDALMTIVDRINSNVKKIPEIEYGYDDNGNVTILVNNLSKINNGATFVGEFFLAVIFFIVQAINGSSLIITVSIKSSVNTVAIVQLNTNLAARSSTAVAVCHTHNVCAVFYFIFAFFVFCGL